MVVTYKIDTGTTPIGDCIKHLETKQTTEEYALCTITIIPVDGCTFTTTFKKEQWVHMFNNGKFTYVQK